MSGITSTRRIVLAAAVTAILGGCAAGATPTAVSTMPSAPSALVATPAPTAGVTADAPATASAAATASPAAAGPASTTDVAATNSPKPAQTAAPTPKPPPSLTAVSARVTFDGKNCVYTGPTAIPAPAMLTIEYAPTAAMESSSVFVVAVRGDTTLADIDRTNADPNAIVGSFVPEWADEGSFNAQQGSGSNRYPLQVLHDPGGKTGTFDKYTVACLPGFPGKPAGRTTILQLVDPTATASALLPSPSPRATIGQPADDGARIVQVDTVDPRTRDLTIESPSVGEARVRLLLPSRFEAQPETRWPVLYLLHGAGGGSTSWTTGSDVEQLTAATDLLVVMPDASAVGVDGWYTDWYNGGAGGWPAWETFHLTELRQLLERNWKTGDKRAVAGLSMGGYGAMTYAARNPGMFLAAASYSGVLDIVGSDFKAPPDRWGDPVAQADTWKQHNPLDIAPALKGLALYVSYGNGEPGPLDAAGATHDDLETWIGTQGDAFAARLEQLGIPATVDAYGPGTHTTPYWERALHRSLPMLLRALRAGGG
jgi:diacylglycerol O-acyltransferase/trehalose O-mycolyltransferase